MDQSHLFIYSSVDGHLGHFQLLAIVNTAVVKMGVQESVWIPVFIFKGYKSEVAGLCGNSRLSFGGNTKLFSAVAMPVCIFSIDVWGFQFLQVLTNTC